MVNGMKHDRRWNAAGGGGCEGGASVSETTEGNVAAVGQFDGFMFGGVVKLDFEAGMSMFVSGDDESNLIED